MAEQQKTSDDLVREALENPVTQNTTASPILSESLFTSKVRAMVEGYKTEILSLETEVRNAVAENFKYLDMPDAGRITGIVEKHLANMNAEILGIKEDLTHFELSKLYKPKGFAAYAIFHPYGIENWGESWGHSYQAFENFFGMGYAEENVRTYDKAWYCRQRFDFSLFNAKTNGMLMFSKLFQWLSAEYCENLNPEFINNVLGTSGSGSVSKRSQSWGGDSSSGHVAASFYGYGIPNSGYYAIDTRRRWQNSSPHWCKSGEGAGNLSGWGGECLRMLRANADGSLTQEPNSDLWLRESFGNSENASTSIYTGDFTATALVLPHQVTTSSHYDRNRQPHYASLMSVRNISTLLHSSNMTEAFNYNGKTDNDYNRIFAYYWTWHDELPTSEDVYNVTELLKMFFECWYRYKRIHYNGMTEPYAIPVNQQLNPKVWLPKGCRHQEQMFKSGYRKGEGAYIQGNLVWEPKYFGISAAEAAADKAWRREAEARGEPVFDLPTFCIEHFTQSLYLLREWGRFFRDQERFHQAQALAEASGSTERDRKNYETLKRWFYTKYNHLRNTSGTDSVQLLSDRVIKLIDSTAD